MANDGHHVGISDKLFRDRDRLGGAALVIKCRQLQAMAGQNRPLRPGVFDGQLGTMKHALALRGLITGQRSGEADLHYRFSPSTADDEYDGENR